MVVNRPDLCYRTCDVEENKKTKTPRRFAPAEKSTAERKFTLDCAGNPVSKNQSKYLSLFLSDAISQKRLDKNFNLVHTGNQP